MKRSTLSYLRSLLNRFSVQCVMALFLATFSHASPIFESIQAFVRSPENPHAKLVQGTDGNFYGTTRRGGGGYGTVFKITPMGVMSTLWNFNGTNGSDPQAELIQSNDENFYGTTSSGGNFGRGTIFKITATGVLTTLFHFNGTNGGTPATGLALGNDGNFYGTTEYGGINGFGTAFKVTPSGTLTTLRNFADGSGIYPTSLIKGSDGNFYGTTFGTLFVSPPEDPPWEPGQPPPPPQMWDPYGYGTVFKISPVGTFELLFTFGKSDGSGPGGLMQASDGNFYGTTSNGGLNDHGTCFKITSTGALTSLVSFNTSNGESPIEALVQGSDGNLYGTTRQGGSNNYGTAFKMSPGGILSTLMNFTGINGRYPSASLSKGTDGNFYGTTENGGTYGYGTVFKMTPAGATTTLVAFKSPEGWNPQSPLVQGDDGNYYGTTRSGGSNDVGTVFKMTPGGTLTTLVNFDSINGGNPLAGLLQGSDGAFYGTTISGGSNGGGTVFKVTSAGTLTTLANFNFTTTSGHYPWSGLIQASDGNFYGTTEYGGTYNYGTVFKMTPTGVLTTLASFTSTSGRYPIGELVQGKDGNFYGTTSQSGDYPYWGDGTVFKVTSAGALTTLVNFTGANGRYPTAALVQGPDGDFYGTTPYGGDTNNGIAFKMTSAGGLAILKQFDEANGKYPSGKLFQNDDGYFYGTNSAGGSGEHGTAFKMTPSGTVTTLVNFTGPNGDSPTGLMQGRDGNLYGTTSSGGTTSNGKLGGGGQVYRIRLTASPDLLITSGPSDPEPSGFGNGALIGFPRTNPAATEAYSLYLRNTGGPPLTGVSAAISGPDAGQFVIPAQPDPEIYAGTAGTSFVVRFNPTTTGVKHATLTIISNDPDESPFTIAIQGLCNTLPSYAGYSATTTQGVALTLSLAKLKAKATDADGDPLTLDFGTSSAHGGTVSQQGSGVLYTPPAGFTGTDSFTVYVQDSHEGIDGLGIGTATITVNASTGSGGGGGTGGTLNPPVLTVNPDGKVTIDFQGIPGRTYLIQRSTDMSNWPTIATRVASASGAISFIDESPPAGSAFYRLAKP